MSEQNIEDVVWKAYQKLKKDKKRVTMRGLLWRSLVDMGVDEQTRDKMVKECSYMTDVGTTYVEAIMRQILVNKKMGRIK